MSGAQLLTRSPTVGGGEAEGPLRPKDPDRWWARTFGGIFVAGGATHLLLLSLDPSA